MHSFSHVDGDFSQFLDVIRRSCSNNLGLLMDVKIMLSQNFDMKDLGEANFVLGIEIHRDRDHKFLGAFTDGLC